MFSAFTSYSVSTADQWIARNDISFTIARIQAVAYEAARGEKDKEEYDEFIAAVSDTNINVPIGSWF